jgi:pimeloyl-ACP methyl ester carboxylesterase
VSNELCATNDYDRETLWFNQFIARLQVLALDLPGHGQSDDPDHELECEEFAEAALAVLDRAANSRGPGGPTGPLRTPSRTPRVLSR